MNGERIKPLRFCALLEIGGYAFLLWGNWRVAIGVFFIHWSINRRERLSR